jgi:hypothetical protein
MKRTFQLLCVLFSVMLLTTACLGSDDDSTTYYDDVAVSSFSLGTLNRYLHTTSSTGADSIYLTTLKGTEFTMTIDQLNHEIYNRDSLPYGTDVKHVVCSLSTRNNAVPYFKSMVSDTLWLYSTTDSMDFSQERLMRVFSSDGMHQRDYKVRLNVKQSSTTGLIWTETENDALSPFAMSPQPVEWGEKEEENAAHWPVLENYGLVSCQYKYVLNTTYTLLIGNDADGHVAVWHRTTAEGSEPDRWVFMTSSDTDEKILPEGVTYSLAYYNSLMLAFSSQGKVYQSSDWGLTWKESSYNQPDGVSGRVEVATDADGTLWLLCVETGKVWKAE